MEHETPVDQVSPDGMWRWDGTQWLPTDRQMQGNVSAPSLEMVSVPESSAHVLGGVEHLDKRAAKAAAKQEAGARREQARHEAAADKARREFERSPVGRARE